VAGLQKKALAFLHIKKAKIYRRHSQALW